MAQVVTYLFFNGNCKEAMEFYQNCLGGKLTFNMLADSPIADQMPAEAKSGVMHADLSGDGWKLFGSDMVGPDGLRSGNTISISVIGKDLAEIQASFDKLAVGGKVTQPLKQESFGTYGDLIDKYGFRWMFQADTPKE